jgi:hypothetical protein
VFNWLVSKKYDCICLQETHCTGVNINRWESEWKTQVGGASAWICGSSESKGVAILFMLFGLLAPKLSFYLAFQLFCLKSIPDEIFSRNVQD